MSALRSALSRFASGVAVVSALGESGVPRCVLASAFNSVSLEPPILLWCVPAAEGAWLGVDRAYGLSVLSEHQAAVVTQDGLRRELLAWEYGEALGAPLLRDAAAWFEVVAARRIAHGDHDLYLGQVATLGYSASQAGLLRYSGALSAAQSS